jgi:hypothetical protein
VLSDVSPVTPAEANAGRCSLCHRKLLAHPGASCEDLERLSDAWGGTLVHRSCAVLAGLMRRDPGWARGERGARLTS